MTCSVQCEYQPPRIFTPAAGLNGIIYIIFNRPAVYFSSGVPEFFLFPSLKDTLPGVYHGVPQPFFGS